MMSSLCAIARCRALAVIPIVFAASALSAQRRPAPEFTQQGVLIGNFSVLAPDGAQKVSRDDLKFGRKVGDGIRDRLDRLMNKKEAKVIDGRDMREAMTLSGFFADTSFSLVDLRQQSEFFRTDEIVYGSATRGSNSFRLDAHLVLWRDIRVHQPIPAVTSNNLDRALDQLAQRINDARVQLKFERRCENAMRDGQGERAIQSAREGIAAYPRGTIVRTCLVWALRGTGAPSSQVLEEAQVVLAIDSTAPHALEAAAVSLDSLHRREEAGDMWLRLAGTDTANLELQERVVFSMAEGGNARKAEPLIVKLVERYPDSLRLVRQKWRVANDNRSWPVAIAAGEVLLAKDAGASADSTFFLRLATAYRAHGQPFKAVETMARGVTTFPHDVRLYALYTQFIKEEADTVIGRGLALYPHSASILALNAKDLRARGKTAEALEASKKAVELDSTISQGRLIVAQGEIELGRPDSALATLRRAVTAGEDRNAVAQFALSKGNTLFRAANVTKSRGDFELAMRFLAFADTLNSTPQTKFLLGAAALNVAQSALTEAPKITVREESCTLSTVGAHTIPLARESLTAGADVSPEATKQFLDYLDQITPFADKQMAAFCAPAPAPKKGGIGPRTGRGI